MVRLLISALLRLVASALGLLVAAGVLDGVTLSASAFVIAVVVFTVVQVVVEPAIQRLAARNVAALRGGTALAATLVALIVTSLVSDGLRIQGWTNWLLATLIVWLVTLLAAVLLPMAFVHDRVEERRG